MGSQGRTIARLSKPQLPARALVPLAVLTLLWGTNWPLFRFAVREVSVWTFRAFAVLLAGIAVLGVARLRGQPLAVARRYWPTIAAGTALYLVLWNVASTYAAILIPSGQAAILGYTMPLWAALLSWGVAGERPTPRLALAIGLGGLGVGLLVWRGAAAYAQAPLGFALGLVAGLGWAAGTLILKRGRVAIPATVLTGWQLLLTAPPMAIGALATTDGRWFMPSWTTIAVIAYIALVPMAIGNVAWFTIVALLPTSVAGLASILVPVVAMFSGALIHGEPLGAIEWLAMICCVGALALALLRPAAPAR